MSIVTKMTKLLRHVEHICKQFFKYAYRGLDRLAEWAKYYSKYTKAQQTVINSLHRRLRVAKDRKWDEHISKIELQEEYDLLKEAFNLQVGTDFEKYGTTQDGKPKEALIAEVRPSVAELLTSFEQKITPNAKIEPETLPAFSERTQSCNWFSAKLGWCMPHLEDFPDHCDTCTEWQSRDIEE